MPRLRNSLVGPLGGWELIRLARRGQTARARLLVLYLLFIAFILIPVLWFPHENPVELFLGAGQDLPREEVTEFAQRLALTLLQVILIAVIAMTPAYAATAIAEEKERQTLPLLLTTPLTDREIVFGKAVGRLVFILAAAAAGFPVLASTVLFGGVDPEFLCVGCAIIASTATLTTAIGLHSACVASDLRGALLRSYGITAVLVCGAFVPPTVFLSPNAVLLWLDGSLSKDGHPPYWVGIDYAAIQVAVACMLLFDAVRRLRREENVREPSLKTVASTESAHAAPDWGPFDISGAADPIIIESEPEWEDSWPRQKVAQTLSDLPPIDDDPIAWKERHIASRRAGAAASKTASVAQTAIGGIALLLAFAGVVTRIGRSWAEQGEKDEAGYVLMVAGALSAGLYLTFAAISLASAIARERNRRTLDALLALPLLRREILGSKVQVALRRGLGWGMLAVLATGLAFGVQGAWWIGIVAGGFMMGNACLAFGLGASLTVQCPTEIRAFRLLIPAVVLVVGAPVGLWNAMNWSDPLWSTVGLNCFSYASASAGYVLWRRACRGMEKIG